MLVAHQGGWDELLIIAIPLLLYAGIRLWERTRGPEAPTTEDLAGEATEEQPDPDG